MAIIGGINAELVELKGVELLGGILLMRQVDGAGPGLILLLVPA